MLRILPFLLLMTLTAGAQKQLVLLKFGKPVGRYAEGEVINVVMKNDRAYEGIIVDLQEFYAIISRIDTVQLAKVVDTVHFNKVYKVKIPKGERKGIAPLFGGLILTSGIVYLGVDLINSAAGYNSAGVDESVVKASAIMIGVGGLLVLIKPKYRRMNNGTFFRTVNRDSKFYKRSD